MNPVEYAQTQLGVKESPAGSNSIKYNTWYYGEKVSGDNYPWCAVFVAYCFYKTGYYKIVSDIPVKENVGSWLNWAKQKGKYKSPKSTPKKGYVVCFSWSRKKETADHIGFVLSDIDGDSIRTIEGNTSDKVAERTRSKDDVIGYIAFDLPSSKSTKKSVTEIAKEVIDGKWSNGAKRKTLLKAAGYSYNKVQREVNRLIKEGYK